MHTQPLNVHIPLFSARDDKQSNETLQWYADRLADAKETGAIIGRPIIIWKRYVKIVH